MTAPRLTVDHLQYVTADVAATSEALAERLGVRPAGGGSHLGLGTRNTLLSLGEDVYLEVIGPDPQQDVQHPATRFPAEPLLRGWAVQTRASEATVAAARLRPRQRGHDEPCATRRGVAAVAHDPAWAAWPPDGRAGGPDPVRDRLGR